MTLRHLARLALLTIVASATMPAQTATGNIIYPYLLERLPGVITRNPLLWSPASRRLGN
jgi:hypothetical protein